MDYAVLRVVCPEELRDVFAAELGETGFDMLLETDDGVEGYIESDLKHTIDLTGVLGRYGARGNWTYTWDTVQNQNWNEEWEKNYDPIIVDGKCLIKANFHNVQEEYPYTLEITPKMSFGTGHHATTWLMVSSMLTTDFKQSTVLDAGCGTGVLAVLAEKLGASVIDAFDVSRHCVENTQENINANDCKNIRALEGTIGELDLQPLYDFILANINKNVLLDEMGLYAEKLGPEGTLLLSGFFEEDISDLEVRAKNLGLIIYSRNSRENWASLMLTWAKKAT